MTYQKQTFIDYPNEGYTILKAEHLRHIEEGIVNVEAQIDIVKTDANPLYAKTIIWDGDSFCAGKAFDDDSESDAWAGRIAKKNNMIYKNYAAGGATLVTGTVDGNGKNRHWISSNIDTMYTEYPNADYIIFQGGMNDSTILGSALNGATPDKFGTFDPNKFDGNYDNTTFCGALETIFYNTISTWKNKKIGFIVSHKTYSNQGYGEATHNARAYYKVAMQICEKWGIPYLNLWDECYLNPSLPNLYNQQETSQKNYKNSLYADGAHLTAAGYDFIATIIENWLKTL